MELFEQERINITELYFIELYDSAKENKPNICEYTTSLGYNELIFVISGQNTVIFGDKTLYDRDNSIRFLPKGETEGRYIVKLEKPSKCIDIYFDSDIPLSAEAIALQNKGALAEDFFKIYNLWRSKRPGYYSKCMSVLYNIINRLKVNDRYSSGNRYENLDRAFDYMVENFKNKDFDYGKMTEASGLSYSYFNSLFTARYKMTPIKYVTKLRIDYAKELLMTKRYSVTDVAELCGFENVYYFSRVFKEKVGLSPKNFK